MAKEVDYHQDLQVEEAEVKLTTKPSTQSAPERKISAILDAAGLPYETEYVFDDLVSSSGRHLRMDFVVFDDAGDIWFAIEYQGEQHYHANPRYGGSKGLQRQKFNDRKKAQYCLDNGIKLISIHYRDEPFLTYDYLIERA